MKTARVRRSQNRVIRRLRRFQTHNLNHFALSNLANLKKWPPKSPLSVSGPSHPLVSRARSDVSSSRTDAPDLLPRSNALLDQQNFKADTTQGPIDFHDFIGNSWASIGRLCRVTGAAFTKLTRNNSTWPHRRSVSLRKPQVILFVSLLSTLERD